MLWLGLVNDPHHHHHCPHPKSDWEMLWVAFRRPLYCVANDRKSHSTGGGGHHWLGVTAVYSVLFRLVRLRRLSGTVAPGWPFLFFWFLSALLRTWNTRPERLLFMWISFVPSFYIYLKSTFFQSAVTLFVSTKHKEANNPHREGAFLKAPALIYWLARHQMHVYKKQ